MQIYTSYYGNLKRLNKEGITPIAISLWNPKWFEGVSIKYLAPTYKTFNSANEKEYIVAFKKQLTKVNVGSLIELLNSMSRGNDVALLCYEKPQDFCHRHLVSDWLNKELNINVTEFADKPKKEIVVNLQKELF